MDSSRTIRITNRKTRTWWRAYSTCIASRSPFAIRPISTSSDVDCIALGRPTCRLVVGAREWVHGSATVMARHFPQESPASCRRRILPPAIWLFEGMPGRDDKRANVLRGLEVARLFQWERSAAPRHRLGSFSSQERLREGPTRHSYYRNTVVIYFQWLRCSSSNIVFADFFCVGFVCGSWLRLRKIAKNGCIERSGQTRGRRERTAGVMSGAVFIFCSITRSRQVCKRNASSARHVVEAGFKPASTFPPATGREACAELRLRKGP